MPPITDAFARAVAASESASWEQCLQHALKAADEEPDAEDRGRAALLAGVAAYELGFLDQALQNYRKAAAVFETIGNRERAAAAKFNEGLALFRASRLVEAISAYEGALQIFSEEGLQRQEATCLMNLGNTCRHVGKVAEALALYQRARTVFQSLGDEDRLARCYLNAGNALVDLNRLQESVAMFSKAQGIFARLGLSQHEGGTLINLADIALREGREEEAMTLAREARVLFERAGASRFLAECDAIEGKALRSTEHLVRAAEKFQEYGDRRQLARVLTDLAQISAPEEAIDHLERAVRQLIELRSELGDPSAVAQSSKPLADTGGRLIRRLCASGRIEDAWNVVQLARERRQQRSMSSGGSTSTSSTTAMREDFSDGRRLEVHLANRAADDFRTQVAQNTVTFHPPVGLTEITSVLSPETVVIEAVVTQDALDLLILKPSGLHHHCVRVRQVELEEAVRAERESLVRLGSMHSLHPVSGVLKSAILEAVRGASLVVWCPADSLEGMPVGPWLVEAGCAWMQSASASFWSTHLQTSEARGTLVVAKSKHGSELGDLPEVIREAENVSTILGGAEVLLDEEATVERVAEAARAAKIIHLASHAQPNESVPLYSRLELWPSEAHPTGAVYGRDLLDWNLEADLVFLSACSTAEGLRSAAGSAISLAWSVLTSGARAVVASSWPVQDRAARQWVDAFYRSYVVLGDPAGAHAAACQELKKDPDHAHPHYWACWKVLGGR